MERDKVAPKDKRFARLNCDERNNPALQPLQFGSFNKQKKRLLQACRIWLLIGLEIFRLNTFCNGKSIIETIPSGSDLVDFIVSVCQKYITETALFSVTGSISSATIGVYDQKQQVYVTHIEKTATELISCLGMITQQAGSPHVSAKIILADQQGNLTGGHLFSQTVVADAQITIQELIGAD